MDKVVSDYPYWIRIAVEDLDWVGSYFSKTPPPRLGEKIDLKYFSLDADFPQKVIPDTLYIVIDVVHCPKDFDTPAYWDAPLSDLNLVNIVVRPLIVLK